MGSTSNPWFVSSIQDFQFFCCPECDSKEKESKDFINHALAFHEQAKDSPLIKSEMKIQDAEEEKLILLHRLKKRKYEHSVTIPILKRRHVIEEIEDHEDTASKQAKEDDNNSDAEEVKDQMNDINEQIEDTVSRQLKEEGKNIEQVTDEIEDWDDSLTTPFEDVDDEMVKVDQSFDEDSDTESQEQVINELIKPKKRERRKVLNTCFPCKIRFSTMKEYYNHIEETHLTYNGYKCDTCNKVKPTRSVWMRHNHQHIRTSSKGLKIRVWQEQNTVEKSESSLDQFIVQDDKDSKPKCKECDQEFENISRLKYHIKTRHMASPITCDICGQVLGSYQSFQSHRMRKHHIRNYKIPSEMFIKKCDKCDTDFKSAEDMENHLRKCHNHDRQLKCKECDKTWVSHLSLELHYVEVHKMMMFCCDTCDYTINEAAILKRHKKAVHEGKRDHICHICGFSSNKNWKVQEHLAKNHGIGEARFKCDICNRAFIDSSTLKNHREGIHLKNVKYNCDQCAYYAYSNPNLIRHKLVKHKKK